MNAIAIPVIFNHDHVCRLHVLVCQCHKMTCLLYYRHTHTHNHPPPPYSMSQLNNFEQCQFFFPLLATAAAAATFKARCSIVCIRFRMPQQQLHECFVMSDVSAVRHTVKATTVAHPTCQHQALCELKIQIDQKDLFTGGVQSVMMGSH